MTLRIGQTGGLRTDNLLVWLVKLHEIHAMNRAHLVALTCLAAAFTGTPSLAQVLTCKSSAADVQMVYQWGANAKIGDIQGQGYQRWLDERLPLWDAAVLQRAWRLTGDYSKSSVSPAALGSGELYRRVLSLDNLLAAKSDIVTRCLRPESDPCRVENPGPAECLAFYAQRYAPVMDRMGEVMQEVLASPRLGHVELVRARAETDFGVPRAQQVVLGEYVSLEFPNRRPTLEVFPLEQANLRAVDRVEAASRGAPALTRGEFETTAAFEVRAKRHTGASSGTTGPTTLASALEAEINPFYVAYVDRQTMKYDADLGAFDVAVKLFKTTFSAAMRLAVPPEGAAAVKAAMLYSNDVYSDPEKFAEPWLVFSLAGSKLTLRGGYLMRRVGTDKQLLLMQPIEHPPVLAVGPEAAAALKPKLEAERQAKTARDRLAQQAQRQEFCRNLKFSVAVNNPTYYTAVVAGAGCD